MDRVNLAAAAERLRVRVELEPDSGDAHGALGTVLMAQGQVQDALPYLRKAIALAPDLFQARLALVEAAAGVGEVDEALTVLAVALEQQPNHALAHEMHGDLLTALGELTPAREAYIRAVALDPSRVNALGALGTVDVRLGRFADAEQALATVIIAAPTHGPTLFNLAYAELRLGHVDAAMARYRTAAEASGAAGDGEAREQALRSIAVSIPGAPGATPHDILAARQAWAAEAVPTPPPRRNPATPITGRPIKVGFMSTAFGTDNWTKTTFGLINAHDRDAVEVHLFSDVARNAVTVSYRADPRDRFHDIAGLDAAGIAERVADAHIDILMNIDGYTSTEQLRVLGHRPAPVAASTVGLYASSGVPGLDYIVGDDIVAPPGDEDAFSETIWRVPCYHTFEIGYPVPDLVDPPSASGTPLTFGCLAPQYKMTDPLLDALARVLNETDGTRLIIRNWVLSAPDVMDHFRERFRARGVDTDRVILEGGADHRTYIRTYDRIDLAIDPFPGRSAAVDRDRAVVGREESDRHRDRRGLAGAVRPEQPEDLARPDREREPIDRARSVEALRDLDEIEEWGGGGGHRSGVAKGRASKSLTAGEGVDEGCVRAKRRGKPRTRALRRRWRSRAENGAARCGKRPWPWRRWRSPVSHRRCSSSVTTSRPRPRSTRAPPRSPASRTPRRRVRTRRSGPSRPRRSALLASSVPLWGSRRRSTRSSRSRRRIRPGPRRPSASTRSRPFCATSGSLR